jgi:hypothetical protein
MEINKYHSSKIYTIRSPKTEKYYIGSTCQPLHKRLYEHRKHYERFQNNNYFYVSSFDIIKYEDHYIELLEDFKCENKNELNRREGNLIRKYKNECVNKRIEGRTKKEYKQDNKQEIKGRMKQYYEDNKEIIKEQKKQYYEDNKEIIKEQMKQYRQDNKEQMKQYYEDNKEIMKEQMKQYQQDNKEKIKEQKNQIIICECGNTYTYSNNARHIKSKKHLQFINKDIEV